MVIMVCAGDPGTASAAQGDVGMIFSMPLGGRGTRLVGDPGWAGDTSSPNRRLLALPAMGELYRS